MTKNEKHPKLNYADVKRAAQLINLYHKILLGELVKDEKESTLSKTKWKYDFSKQTAFFRILQYPDFPANSTIKRVKGKDGITMTFGGPDKKGYELAETTFRDAVTQMKKNKLLIGSKTVSVNLQELARVASVLEKNRDITGVDISREE